MWIHLASLQSPPPVSTLPSSEHEKGLPDAELGDGGSYGSEVGVSTSSIMPYAVSGAGHQLSPVAIRARSLADSQIRSLVAVRQSPAASILLGSPDANATHTLLATQPGLTLPGRGPP